MSETQEGAGAANRPSPTPTDPHEGIQTEFETYSWDNFLGRDSDSEQWCLSSERLAQAAARLLEPAPARAFSVAGVMQQNLGGLEDPWDLSYVWGMLAGMSLEALLKGIVAVQRNGVIRPEDGSPLPGFFRAHRLRQITEHLGIELEDDERKLLDRLEACVLWKGRYPVPNREEHYEPPDAEEFQPFDARRFAALRERFEGELRGQIIPSIIASSRRRAEAEAREAEGGNAQGNPEVM